MKQFIKNKENFVCRNCNQKVIGNGYTNHCPKCLYSVHVDQFPGDRKSSCGGLMKPVGITTKNGEEKIIHCCLKCGLEKINRLDPKDDRETLLKVIKSLTK